MERTRQKERAAAPAAPVPLLPRSDAACSSTALPGSSLGSLDAELQRSTVSYLEPHAFFVSWQGVLTLAYRCVCFHAVGGTFSSRRREAEGSRRGQSRLCMCMPS